MSQPKVSAIIDQNILRVGYTFKPSSPPNVPVDLTVRYLYLNKRTDGGFVEVEFNRLTLPKEALALSGIPGVTEISQSAEIKLLNPTYRRSAYVEIIEDRGAGPTAYRVPVLLGDESGDYYQERTDNPSNPAREDIDENLPKEEPERAMDNIVVPEPELRVIAIGLSDMNFIGLPKWILQDETLTEVKTTNLIENGIVNLMPNADLAWGMQPNAPEDYTVEGPGLLLFGNSSISGVTDTWRIRASNPNWLNAFGAVSWFPTTPIDISPGTQSLTFSFYYKIRPESEALPVNTFQTQFEFLDSSDANLPTISLPATPIVTTEDWILYQASVHTGQIPSAAVKVRPKIRTNGVEGPSYFIWEIMAPQLEEQRAASSRAVESRLPDVVATKSPLQIALPMRLTVETQHLLGSGLRGLMATTIGRRSGFEWTVSAERMFFKVYDTAGTVTSQAYSSALNLSHLQRCRYSVALSPSDIRFFVDDVLVGTAPLTPTAIEATVRIGGLELQNTNLHAPLYNVAITRNP